MISPLNRLSGVTESEVQKILLSNRASSPRQLVIVALITVRNEVRSEARKN